jgi:hypothetical protein
MGDLEGLLAHGLLHTHTHIHAHAKACMLVCPLEGNAALLLCARAQVALRRRAAGKRDGVMAGETVPYVICLRLNKDQQQQQQQHEDGSSTTPAAVKVEEGVGSGSSTTPAAVKVEQAAEGGGGGPAATEQQHQQQQLQMKSPGATGVRAASGGAANGHSSSSSGGGSGGGGGGLAERAFHPDELRTDASLVIDADYYLAQQVLPVVVRLCAPIEVRRGHLGTYVWVCVGVPGIQWNGFTATSCRQTEIQTEIQTDTSHRQLAIRTLYIPPPHPCCVCGVCMYTGHCTRTPGGLPGTGCSTLWWQQHWCKRCSDAA